ncbi:hypothetical protein K523DRAFT_363881 [Schizophyllum commune Tattone D]|nr:hypothetical protein K523DRAFT_363881 [Schizophyllum commune Tattone D]
MARTPMSSVAKKQRMTVTKKQRSTSGKKSTTKQQSIRAKAACCARDRARYKTVLFPDLYIADYTDDRCDKCGFKAKTTIEKLRHLIVHIPRDHPAWVIFRRCQCIICGQQLPGMDQAADHYSRWHRASFNYPCPHEGCDVKKGDRAGVYRHRRRAHGYRTKKELEAEAAGEGEGEGEFEEDDDEAREGEEDADAEEEEETADVPHQTIQDYSAPTSNSSTPLATPPPPGFSSTFEAPCAPTFVGPCEHYPGEDTGMPSSSQDPGMPAYGAGVYGLDSFAPRQTDFYFAGEHGFHFAQKPSFNFAPAMDVGGFTNPTNVGGFATPTNIDGFATPPVDFDAFSQLAQPAPSIATLSAPAIATPPQAGSVSISRSRRPRSQNGIQFSGFEFSNPDGRTLSRDEKSSSRASVGHPYARHAPQVASSSPANIPRPTRFPPTWHAEVGMRAQPSPLALQPVDAFNTFHSMDVSDTLSSVEVSDAYNSMDVFGAYNPMAVSDAYNPWFDLRGAPMVDFGDAIVP